jgi:thiol-disulfide isomerase/thioredoxin
LGEIPTEDGVYLFEPGRGWLKLATLLTPSSLKNGISMIYFKNNWCVPCRVLDLKMPDIIRMYSCKASLYVVTCKWFTSLCLDTVARRAFQAFKVTDSPTLWWAVVSGGRIVKEVRIAGVPSIAELRKYVSDNLGIGPCRASSRSQAHES